MDKSGVLTLKDRSKDMIISGGMNIYPREIEDLLINLTTVTEVAVVGTANEKMGRRGRCLCSWTRNQLKEKLDSHCLNHLARFKRPKRYIFLDSLPKNNYGKNPEEKIYAFSF